MEHYFTNSNTLRSEIRTIHYENQGEVFTFFSDLGVFSKNKIDYGSSILVGAILKNEENISSILDVGCGYGFIGIVLGKMFHSFVTLSDVNKRAIHLCERNLKENSVSGKVVLSNAFDCISNPYDLIVTNPPIRAGKEVVLKILTEAKGYLNKNGSLWFVIRKDQGVKSIIKLLEDIYSLEVIAKDKGFYVVKATKQKLIDTCNKCC